jgi:phosphoribosylformylglycinamidine (FGAM) synthase-like enzyme
MSWGYNPFITEKSPYHGAYLAVVESVCKLIATGAEFKDVYLTFQEYFEHPRKDGKRWGKPLAALLGAYKAQMNLGVAAIGGKDSMSGSFEDLDVPPTLVSFAVTTDKLANVTTPEFKKGGHPVYWFRPAVDENGLPMGFSSALLAEIANRAQVNIETVLVENTQRTDALSSGNADALFWVRNVSCPVEGCDGYHMHEEAGDAVVTESYFIDTLAALIKK